MLARIIRKAAPDKVNSSLKKLGVVYKFIFPIEGAHLGYMGFEIL